MLALAPGCGDGEQRPPASQAPPRPSKPSLRLVALTDPSGYLEPCGCQKRPLGGIDKAATRLNELGADGVPSLLVAAGDLFFEARGDGGHGESAPALEKALEKELRFQQDTQAESLADAFARLGLAAAVSGPADAAHDAGLVTKLAERGRFALLQEGAAAQRQLIERGGVRVGLFGLTGAAAADARAAMFAAQAHVDALRAQGAQVTVALVAADARAARRVAGGVKGLDFLVHGGLASASVTPPERVGTTTLLRAAHNGHGLLVVELFRAGDGAFADISAWTRERELEGVERRISELRGRLAQWERDPKADPKLVGEQRARLAALEAQRGSRAPSQAAPSNASGNAFSARFVELDPDVAGEPKMRALLDEYYARINERNRTALAKVPPLPVKAGDPSYVGSARCGDCHESEHAWWKGHAHGKAYETLVTRNKQFNLSCVACHVTGYGKPGGAAVVQNAGLIDVGCESCHGPGSLHAADQDVDEPKNVVSDTPEAVCKTCHNEEHSDAFDYATYKAKLIVPGHGQAP